MLCNAEGERERERERERETERQTDIEREREREEKAIIYYILKLGHNKVKSLLNIIYGHRIPAHNNKSKSNRN